MRLAKSSRNLLPLALLAGLATCASAQEHPNVSPNAVRGQLSQPSSPAPAAASQAPASPSQAEVKVPKKKPATPPAGAAAAPKAPARAAVQAPAKAPASAPAASKTPAKPGEKAAAGPKGTATAQAPAKPGAGKPAEEKPVVRRDPFDTLLTKARAGNAPPENLPPGKAGLIVETLRIDGIVHSPNGMIAIVSNPQQRVYFLRDGDKLYDGAVEKISLDSISFHENGKDAFGKPLERTVTKRLYPTPGEQQ